MPSGFIPSPTASHRVYTSPNRTYDLQSRLAAGDLCDVHRASADGSEYVLKIPRVPEGDALLVKEFSTLATLHDLSQGQSYQKYFPEPVESFLHQNRRINAFVWRDGFFTAEQILARYPNGLPGEHLAWTFNRLLEALGFVHQSGFVHGAVLPPHVTFHPESHGLQLVGWIHVEKIPAPLKLASDRFKAWYPPECRQKKPATPATDLYLAAKTMLYLAGGDPLTEAFPDSVPARMQKFFRGCLLASPRMRPQSAWDLHTEFRDLLEDLYGPPTFHPLQLP